MLCHVDTEMLPAARQVKLRESLNTIFSGFRAINSVGIAILKLNLWPPSFIFTWPNAKLFSLRSSCMKNEHDLHSFPLILHAILSTIITKGGRGGAGENVSYRKTYVMQKQ